jgi:uncharacterized protein YjbI with pentapeptide repeats
MIPNAFAQSVPDWVKNTAGWWAEDAISETEFVNAIAFLIKEDIIKIDESTASTNSKSVPEWVKNTAGWWAKDAISETEFVNAVTYLVNVGIISTDRQNEIINFEYLQKTVSRKNAEIKFNSDGFRYVEINKKPSDTYRIFIIGGSTVFGEGVESDETIPYYVQKKFDDLNLGKKIQVINAGVSSSWSAHEFTMINDKIMNYEPDFLIIYGGWNDLDRFTGSVSYAANPNWWGERQSIICDRANEHNIEIMIALQPFVGTGERILTNQEYILYFDGKSVSGNYISNYELYANQLKNLESNCSKTLDLRNVFDNVYTPIYWDAVHLGAKGNEIISEQIFGYVLPIVLNSIGNSEDYEITKKNDGPIIDFKSERTNFSNSDFSNQNLSNSNFIFADLTDVNFENSTLSNSIFRFAKISNTNFNGAEMENVKFSYSNIDNSKMTNSNLNNSEFFGATIKNTHFHNSELTNSDLRAVSFDSVIFSNTKLENSDFSHSVVYNSDFTTSNILNTKFHSTSLFNNNFKEIDFSTVEIFGKQYFPTKLAGSDLSNANLSKTDLSHVDFSPQKFNDEFLSGTILSFVDFSSNPSFVDTVISKIPCLDCDLTPPLDATVITTENIPVLTYRGFIIEKLDTLASLLVQCNEMFPIDENVEMEELGWKCHDEAVSSVSVVDFDSYDLDYIKNSSVSLYAADLSGLDLSNKNVSHYQWSFHHTYSPYSGSLSIMENNNMIGIDLRQADLSYTNLQNVDLSYSNLEGANLEKADLSGANLQGANLKCLNHPICK